MTRTLLAAVAAALIPLSLAGPAWGCDEGRRAAAAHSIPAPAGRAPLEIGDSTSIFAAPVLGRLGVEADAHGCRNFGQGLGIISARRRASTLPGVVVMALVANAGVSRRQISNALRALGPSRILALVTAPKSGAGDATQRAAAAAHPDRVLLIDWAVYSAGHGGWFGGDGLHVGQPGAEAFARLIRRRIAPYAFPPVKTLKLPRHTTSSTACGTVTRAARRRAVFLVRGHRILSCARARELARSPLLHPPAGWRTYDWRHTGHGRWLRVMRRTDGKALLATAPATTAKQVPIAHAARPVATLVFSSDRVVRIGKFKVSNPTVPAARAHFGRPTNVRELYGASTCIIEWRSIGLAINFADYGSTDACGNTGLSQSLTIKGQAGRQSFRTRAGLRVGDSVGRLRRLYPAASRHGTSWWLASARTYLGSCNGCAYGVVTAKITGGRVSSLHASIAAGGE